MVRKTRRKHKENQASLSEQLVEKKFLFNPDKEQIDFIDQDFQDAPQLGEITIQIIIQNQQNRLMERIEKVKKQLEHYQSENNNLKQQWQKGQAEFQQIQTEHIRILPQFKKLRANFEQTKQSILNNNILKEKLLQKHQTEMEKQLNLDGQLQAQQEMILQQQEQIQNFHMRKNQNIILKEAIANENIRNINGDLIYSTLDKLTIAIKQINMQLHRTFEDNNLCVVCMDNARNMVLSPCLHFCICQSCSLWLDDCPVCRKKVRTRTKIYI